MAINGRDVQVFERARQAIDDAAHQLDLLYDHCQERSEEEGEVGGIWKERAREMKRLKSLEHKTNKDLERAFA